MIDPEAPAHRFLEQYAKQYHAGAFATPTRKDLLADPAMITEDTRVGRERAVVVAKRLTRDSVRTDFTGGRFGLPKGAYVASHLARTPNLLPDLDPYDYVMAYAEDREIGAILRDRDRRVLASRVTAAAEVINVWGPHGARSTPYPAHDLATVVDMGEAIRPGRARQHALTEVSKVRGWDDDFPYYSDGSWSAVCLKGFWPDEPGRGVKPTEMPKSWKLANRNDLIRTAQWTTLADELPQLSAMVRDVDWWAQTERVRLLRMAAGGRLGRHSDITDRDGGTRDGQVVRFHIPLITDPATKLITWDLDGVRRETHLRPWHMYYLDARKPHAVVNPGAVNRVHLTVDVISSPEVREKISEAYRRAR